MLWIRSHRYTVALIGAAVFVVVGGIIAKNSSETGAERAGIVNVAVEYPYYVPPAIPETSSAKDLQQTPQNSMSGASSSTPPFPLFGRKPTRETPAIVTEPPASPKVKPSEIPIVKQNTALDEQYLRFFQSLANILSPIDARTPEQKALFNYGNEAGSLIKTFEDTHAGVVQTLKAFFDTHTDTSKIAGSPEAAKAYAQLTAASGVPISTVPKATAASELQAVANDYAQLSAKIAGIRDVPPEAEAVNSKLAKGYADVAQGLSKLGQAEGNAQMLDAINAYNANADEFIKNYVAMVKLFSARGVKFGANDSGAIFSFSTQ